MTPSITLGRLFDITVGLQVTLLTAASVTAAFFFVSIVVHELAHALVARDRRRQSDRTHPWSLRWTTRHIRR